MMPSDVRGILKMSIRQIANGKYLPADSKIDGKTLVVWDDKISNPVSVKMGFSLFSQINLKNNYGLPASPFRTDAKY
jgi:hypothetical protein